MSGKFTWYELLTSDAQAAADFYTTVVGWWAEDAGMEQAYTLLKQGGDIVGGIMGLPADMLPNGPTWRGYVEVDDVDGAADQVTAAGAVLRYGPMDIPNVGRFAIVSDPQGATFSLYKGMPGVDGGMKEGFVGWRELHTTDVDAALGFYYDQLGWTEERTYDMGGMGTYHIFNSAEGQQGGAMTSPNMPRPIWLYYFNVGDIDAAAARVNEAGGQIMMGPHQVPGGGWILQATDPQGAMFALLGSKAAA